MYQKESRQGKKVTINKGIGIDEIAALYFSAIKLMPKLFLDEIFNSEAVIRLVG